MHRHREGAFDFDRADKFPGVVIFLHQAGFGNGHEDVPAAIHREPGGAILGAELWVDHRELTEESAVAVEFLHEAIADQPFLAGIDAIEDVEVVFRVEGDVLDVDKSALPLPFATDLQFASFAEALLA